MTMAVTGMVVGATKQSRDLDINGSLTLMISGNSFTIINLSAKRQRHTGKLHS